MSFAFEFACVRVCPCCNTNTVCSPTTESSTTTRRDHSRVPSTHRLVRVSAETSWISISTRKLQQNLDQFFEFKSAPPWCSEQDQFILFSFCSSGYCSEKFWYPSLIYFLFLFYFSSVIFFSFLLQSEY